MRTTSQYKIYLLANLERLVTTSLWLVFRFTPDHHNCNQDHCTTSATSNCGPVQISHGPVWLPVFYQSSNWTLKHYQHIARYWLTDCPSIIGTASVLSPSALLSVCAWPSHPRFPTTPQPLLQCQFLSLISQPHQMMLSGDNTGVSTSVHMCSTLMNLRYVCVCHHYCCFVNHLNYCHHWQVSACFSTLLGILMVVAEKLSVESFSAILELFQLWLVGRKIYKGQASCTVAREGVEQIHTAQKFIYKEYMWFLCGLAWSLVSLAGLWTSFLKTGHN